MDYLPAHEDPTKWRKDATTGQWIMPEKQSRFLDWLLSDPKDPPTQKAWAEANAVNDKTIGDWKRNTKFRSEWERRAVEKNISIENTQDVIQTLYKAAKRGDTQAAKFYMSYVEKFLPPKRVERDDSVAHLTDAELEAEMRALLDSESLVDDGSSDPTERA